VAFAFRFALFFCFFFSSRSGAVGVYICVLSLRISMHRRKYIVEFAFCLRERGFFLYVVSIAALSGLIPYS